MSHYKVIGQSVDNSLSPKLFEFIFKYLKIDAEYDYQNISDLNNLSHFIDNLILNNISGFNVTMPFKKDVLSYAHYVEEDAKNIAAANCIKIIDNQLYAYNTDHMGFSKFISHQGIDFNDSSVIVLGSGGSSQAILYSLLNQNRDYLCRLEPFEDARLGIVRPVSDIPVLDSLFIIRLL